MRIGIDYIATVGDGGNAIYSKNLIDSILETDTENEYYLYAYAHDVLRGTLGTRKSNVHYRPAYFSTLGLPIPRGFIRWLNSISVKCWFVVDRLDVFHFTNPINFVRGLKKYIVTIHDLSSFHDAEWTKIGSREFFSKNIKNILDLASRIIAVSEYTKHDTIEMFSIPENKIDVVYEAADSLKYYSDVDGVYVEEKFNLRDYVLYLGQLQPRKNIVGLIRAYGALPTNLKNTYTLVLAGSARDTDYSNEILVVIKELQLEKYIKILGRVSDDSARKLYSSARAFLFPSLFEGFGLPVLESLQCGTPVITSSTTSLPEVVGDAGILVDPKSIESISQALTQMLEDNSVSSNLKNQTLVQAAKFSWKKAAQKTVSIYKKAYEN